MLALFRGWKKDKAEATRNLVTSSTDLVDRLETRLDKVDEKLGEQNQVIANQSEQIASQRKQIAVLAAKVNVLESEKAIMLHGIEGLCEQLQGSGQEPVWVPEVDDDGRIVG